MAYIECTDELWQSIEAIALEEGLGLYDLEVQGQPKVCVIVDRVASDAEQTGGPVKPSAVAGAGVTSDDCSRLCRRLMVYFHAEGARLGLGDEPQIDVSSPGVNRNLRLEKHFQDAVGERIRVVLSQAIDPGEGEKPIGGPVVGQLMRVENGELCLKMEAKERELTLPFSHVKKARVDFEFPF